MKRITQKAGAQADKVNWEIVRKAVQDHSGIPVLVMGPNTFSNAKNSKEELEILMNKAEMDPTEKIEIKEEIYQTEVALEESEKPVEKTTMSTRANFNLNQ
jgi:hypothetical protein